MIGHWGSRPPKNRRPNFLEWVPGDTALLLDFDKAPFIDEALWAVDTDGSTQRRIKDLNPIPKRYGEFSLFNFYAGLSPDGKRILYSTCEFNIPPYHDSPAPVERHSALGFELAVVNLDGSNTKRLTVSEDYENFPSWSPDGTRMAYLHRIISSGNEERPQGRIVVSSLTLDGELQETQSYGVHAASVRPAWSPDGRFLAFGEYDVDSKYHPDDTWLDHRRPVIFVAEPGRQTEVVELGVSSASPAWDPDSKRLALANLDTNRLESGISIVNADGTGASQIWEGNREVLHMEWHPDGTEILIVTQRHSPSEKDPGLWTINVEDGRIRYLLPPYTQMMPAVASWSHDGTKVAVRGPHLDGEWDLLFDWTGFMLATMDREGRDIRLIAVGGEEPRTEPGETFPGFHTCPGAPAWDGLSDARDTCVAREE